MSRRATAGPGACERGGLGGPFEAPHLIDPYSLASSILRPSQYRPISS